MVKIITDSSALYTVEQGKELGFDVLTLSVTINHKSYKEFTEINSKEFVKMIQEGAIPTSSQPSIGDAVTLFEQYPDEEVLAICMADGLSGTYQSTETAKQHIENNDHIYVLSSETLCGPHRHLVDIAMKLKNEGKNLSEIVNVLREKMSDMRSFLIPQDFSFLQRGGRLTPLAAKIGGMLKIVPVMRQTDDGRQLEKFAVKRTMKAAVKAVIDDFKALNMEENHIIYVTHACVPDQAKDITDFIQKHMPKAKVEIYELSPVFITQGGPGCIAIQAIGI